MRSAGGNLKGKRMARFYSYEWTDGKAFLADIEPDVEVHVDDVCGEPRLRIDALRIDGVDILKSPSPSVKAIAEEIRMAILQDSEWIGERLQEEGWTYRSRGGMDPSAHWVQA